MQREKLSNFIIKNQVALIDINQNVHEALKLLNVSPIKTLFVIKKNKEEIKFFGTITDGDVRRFLIKKINTHEKIKYLYNKKSKFLYSNENNFKKKISSIYQQLFINYIPVLNKKKNYLGYIDAKKLLQKLNYLKEPRKFDLFIMAGGFGKRLRPLTYTIPKPLILINGLTIISRILKSIPSENVGTIFISLHYKSILIKNYINKNYKDKKIIFFEEKKPLGTAGSLYQLKKIKKNTNCLLVNADISTNIDFNLFFNFHLNFKSDFTVCSSNYKIDVPFGVITATGKRVKKITEKPILNLQVNTGIYFFNVKILNLIKNRHFISATDLISILIKKKLKVYYYPIYEQWIDIGSKEDLKKAKSLLI
jgi:dTDP-glucose pyrophosphorylase